MAFSFSDKYQANVKLDADTGASGGFDFSDIQGAPLKLTSITDLAFKPAPDIIDAVLAEVRIPEGAMTVAEQQYVLVSGLGSMQQAEILRRYQSKVSEDVLISVNVARLFDSLPANLADTENWFAHLPLLSEGDRKIFENDSSFLFCGNQSMELAKWGISPRTILNALAAVNEVLNRLPDMEAAQFVNLTSADIKNILLEPQTSTSKQNSMLMIHNFLEYGINAAISDSIQEKKSVLPIGRAILNWFTAAIREKAIEI